MAILPSIVAGKLALRKIDLFAAFFTGLGFVELVREDFDFLLAIRTVACKGFQILELFKTGTVLGCGHGTLLYGVFLVG
jgi:hypothetical protein